MGFPRGYSWADFTDGNDASHTHGANSKQKVDPLAIEFRDRLIAECPWMAEIDAGQIMRYCRAQVREHLLHTYIEERVDELGVGAVAVGTWQSADNAAKLAAKLAQDLGLDPTGRFKLLKDAGLVNQLGSDAVAQLAARGKALRAQREGRELGTSQSQAST